MAAIPAIEIVNWVASTAYLNDPSVIDEGIKFVLNVTGVLDVWNGLQTERPNTYLATAWTSIEAHEALEADKARYAQSLALLAPAMAADPEAVLFHADLDPDYPLVFNSPATEFVQVLPNDGVTANTTSSLLAQLKEDAVKTCGALAASWGPIVEQAQTLMAVVGWKSVSEANDACFADITKDLQASATLTLSHAHMREGA
ncbi:hypothetical protein HETIRDRAFT_163995 [Heterobasidion irregulare TC 32-1]|uniref:ABM domain-containing protein n=1 Tax=Heterobasidion irregulare (strain TC 32-1) TaxID=747525 RepID=W4JYS1_HETIT|nr:uncharacterized protein HETIRDRAFT_163995 [Heterobasidion irregulare TC 32-1]ETW78016.1 hypothetical protein HETIRDRAFT_163995 [Heterobasidion irregulare TC 32-1]